MKTIPTVLALRFVAWGAPVDALDMMGGSLPLDLLIRVAEALPESDVLVCGGGHATRLERWNARRAIARDTWAVGIEPGERVVHWATNVPEWIVLEFALAKIGAVLVPAHTISISWSASAARSQRRTAEI